MFCKSFLKHDRARNILKDYVLVTFLLLNSVAKTVYRRKGFLGLTAPAVDGSAVMGELDQEAECSHLQTASKKQRMQTQTDGVFKLS